MKSEDKASLRPVPPSHVPPPPQLDFEDDDDDIGWAGMDIGGGADEPVLPSGQEEVGGAEVKVEEEEVMETDDKPVV